MKNSILFLNGSYARRDLAFYLGLCDGKFTVAVDGGYRFFRAAHQFPDLLIGDFDSIRRMPRDLPETTIVRQYPTQKDKTDAELALDYCLDRKSRQIDIVQPSYGEPDQLLGNFLLLLVAAGKTKSTYQPRIRIINRRYEVQLLDNSRVTMLNAAGDVVSVLPLSKQILLTTTGAEYNVRRSVISRGRSLGMRNRVARAKASFRIEGTALLIRQFKKEAGRQAGRLS